MALSYNVKDDMRFAARYTSRLKYHLEQLYALINKDYKYFSKELGIIFEEMYSCGSFGCAFPTTNEGITAKFTTDHHEVMYYKFSEKYQNKLQFLPEIFLIEELSPHWHLVLREAATPLVGDQEYSCSEKEDILNELFEGIDYISDAFLPKGTEILDVDLRNIGSSEIDGRFILFDGRIID